MLYNYDYDYFIIEKSEHQTGYFQQPIKCQKSHVFRLLSVLFEQQFYFKFQNFC